MGNLLASLQPSGRTGWVTTNLKHLRQNKASEARKRKPSEKEWKILLQTVFFFTESRFSWISRILPYTAHGISLSSFTRFTIAPISVVISLRTPVTPWFMEWFHALCEIPAYLRQLTYALRRRVLGWKYIQLLAAPSAVNLAACISTRFSASRTLCARICCFDLRFNGFGVFDFSSIYYAWCKMLNIFLG